MVASGQKAITAGLKKVSAVERTLKKAGVEFIEENGGGVGVRLKRRKKGKS